MDTKAITSTHADPRRRPYGMRRTVEAWQAANPAALASDPAGAQFHMEDAIADIQELASLLDAERQRGQELARAVRSLALDIADPVHVKLVIDAMRMYSSMPRAPRAPRAGGILGAEVGA